MTLFDKWNKIKNGENIEILKFYFKNFLGYKNYKSRKFKSGIKVETSTKTLYFEKAFNSMIILKYEIKNGVISTCIGEIDLEKFIKKFKNTRQFA
jgi:hypothetical protein